MTEQLFSLISQRFIFSVIDENFNYFDVLSKIVSGENSLLFKKNYNL